MNISKDSVLALAGIFQAASLIEQIALTGTVDAHDFRTSINSIFHLEPENVLAVFGNVSDLTLGLEKLTATTTSNDHNTADKSQMLQYVLGILQLERQFIRRQNMTQQLRNKLEYIRSQAEYFSPTHENVIAALSDSYQATLSALRYRIQITGKASYLKQPENFAKIRALLLAGLRSAVLWRQCGGGRMTLLLKRKQIVKVAKQWKDVSGS